MENTTVKINGLIIKAVKHNEYTIRQRISAVANSCAILKHGKQIGQINKSGQVFTTKPLNFVITQSAINYLFY